MFSLQAHLRQLGLRMSGFPEGFDWQRYLEEHPQVRVELELHSGPIHSREDQEECDQHRWRNIENDIS